MSMSARRGNITSTNQENTLKYSKTHLLFLVREILNRKYNILFVFLQVLLNIALNFKSGNSNLAIFSLSYGILGFY